MKYQIYIENTSLFYFHSTMKAPRKTVKRPIYRYIKAETSDDKNEDVKIIEKKDDNAAQIPNSPSFKAEDIKFEQNEPLFKTEDIMKDQLQLIDTFNDILKMDDFESNDIFEPEDFDNII